MNKYYNIIEENNLWRLQLVDTEVARCIIDYAFTIALNVDNKNILVRLEQHIIFKYKGVEKEIKVDDLQELSSLLLILHSKVEKINIYKSGKLELFFSNGMELTIPPNKNYEAWEISGPEKLLIVCAPGGEVSFWS